MPSVLSNMFSNPAPVVSYQLQLPNYIPVIAEIGINHNGDIDIAKKLVLLAHEAGCDAVKFQKRDIETVYSEEVLNAFRESPWGTTQRQQKKGLEFGQAEYKEIDRYCKELGIAWSASAWDSKSLDFVDQFSPEFHKVASAFVTNVEFLKEVAKKGRNTILSTGMAEMSDIAKAVEVFTEAGTPIVLMHTVSTYPSPESDLNLRLISTLRERFGVPVGYSGHESSISPSIVAMGLGAVVVERHITLDRTMYGSDQAASIEESGLRQLVATARKITSLWGDGIKKYAPGEAEVAKKLRYWD